MSDPLGVELLAAAGFDWVCIDCQHGMIDLRAAVDLIRALDCWQVPALVRVPGNDAAAIGAVLDAGAAGVIVPMIESVEETRLAVRACRYPPAGVRSWGPVRAALRAPGYGPASADREALCFVMVESEQSVAAVSEIARVPGLDGIFVGTADLSLCLTGDPVAGDGAMLDSALAEVSRACDDAGIVAGLPSRPEVVADHARAGFSFLAIFSDTHFLAEGARMAVERATRCVAEQST